jgi:hypothetical protein
MNKTNKLSSVVIACAISISALYAASSDERIKELEKKVEMLSTTTAAGNFGATTALARAEPDGYGWFLTFDVLYWQSKVAGLSYAIVNASDTYTPVINDLTVKEPEFDWTFAFKVGVGYNFCHDGWDTHIEYTYFRNTASGSCSVDPPSAITAPDADRFFSITADTRSDITEDDAILTNFATEASSHVKLNFNDLYWDLGRDFFISQSLSLRPSLGLKASWISIHRHEQYSGGGTLYSFDVAGYTVSQNGLGSETIYVSNSRQFVGVGPRGALGTKWHLGEGFSIYGDFASALLFGYFKVHKMETYTGNASNYTKFHGSMHRLIPTVDFELGLMYEKYIMCDSQHFSIRLGYETQYFWEVSYATDNVGPRGVGMYGVNLDLRWDF